MKEKYLSATIFKELLHVKSGEEQRNVLSMSKVLLLDPDRTKKAEMKPDKSSLGTYEEIFSND